MVQNATRLADRARGCILAGAIGDAMGGPYEGQPGPLHFRDHKDWKISDDSQLTLATCESVTALSEVSPEHIAARFVHWFRRRRITGMGSSTLKAIRDLDAGAHWALAGARGEMSAGNGAAMRIPPLAFHLDPRLRKIVKRFATWAGASEISGELVESLPTAPDIERIVDEFAQAAHLPLANHSPD